MNAGSGCCLNQEGICRLRGRVLIQYGSRSRVKLWVARAAKTKKGSWVLVISMHATKHEKSH